jgi:serine protease Do
MSRNFSQIAERTSPAVVGLEVEKTIEQSSPFGEDRFYDPFDDDFFDFFFRRRSPRRHSPHRRSPRPKVKQTAQGSGFIISADGYILTNNHLVGDTDKITIKLTDGRKFEAELIGTDPESDVAVIKIDADNLGFLELADSDKVQVGEWVLAIGNPFGLSHTVTSGIVSAKGRSIGLTNYEDFIQTDAAINPGNSGGPLLNLDGKVVGINTAIISRNGGNMGIGMAIPINMAKSIYEQLVDGGIVVRGFLGVSLQELTPELAKSFGLNENKGVVITEVVEDSAAEKAGIEQGDIVVEFDNKPVEQLGNFRNRVAMLKPGTKAKIVVIRAGKRKKITVELGERPGRDKKGKAQPQTLEELGFSVQNLTDELAEQLGYQGLTGVVVSSVEPGSSFGLAGISPGILIQEVNREAVTNVEEFKQAIEDAKKQGSALLLIRNKTQTLFLVLPLP